MNRVHSLLDKYDLKCKYDHIFGVNGIRWLKSIELKGNDHIQLVNYIHSIEFLNSEIRQIEKQISIEASNNENIKILMMSMTGIDYFSAMLISSEIGDLQIQYCRKTCIMVWNVSNSTSIWYFDVHGQNEKR